MVGAVVLRFFVFRGIIVNYVRCAFPQSQWDVGFLFVSGVFSSVHVIGS